MILWWRTECVSPEPGRTKLYCLGNPNFNVHKNRTCCMLKIQLPGPSPRSSETASLIPVVCVPLLRGTLAQTLKTHLESCQCTQEWLKTRVQERNQASHPIQSNNRRGKAESIHKSINLGSDCGNTVYVSRRCSWGTHGYMKNNQRVRDQAQRHLGQCKKKDTEGESGFILRIY